mgnify:CR=1 FL=1
MKVGDLLISKSLRHVAILLEFRGPWWIKVLAQDGKVFTTSRKGYEVYYERKQENVCK